MSEKKSGDHFLRAIFHVELHGKLHLSSFGRHHAVKIKPPAARAMTLYATAATWGIVLCVSV